LTQPHASGDGVGAVGTAVAIGREVYQQGFVFGELLLKE
jgi:hypothetical protein